MSEHRPPRDPSDAAAESTREAMDLGRLLSAGGTAAGASSHDAILSTLRQMLGQNLALPPQHVQLDTNLPRPQRDGSKPKGRPAPTPRSSNVTEDRKEMVSTGIKTSPQQNNARVASSPATRFAWSSSSGPDSATITPSSSFTPQKCGSTNQTLRPRENVPNAASIYKPIAPSPSQQQQIRQIGTKPETIPAAFSTTQPGVSISGGEHVAFHHAGLGAVQQLLQAQMANGVLPQSVLAALLAQATAVPPVSLPDPPHLNPMLSFTVPTQPHFLIPSTGAYGTKNATSDAMMQAFGHHTSTAIPRNTPNPTASVSLPSHSYRPPPSRTGSSVSSSVAPIPSTMTPVAGLTLAPLPIPAYMLPPQGSTEQQLQQLQYIQLLLALQQSSQSNPTRSYAGPPVTTTTASSVIPMITTQPHLPGMGNSSTLHLSMVAPSVSIGADAPMPAGAPDTSGRNKRKTMDAPRRGSSAGRTEVATLDGEDAIKRRRICQKQLDVLEAAYQDDPLPSRRTKQRLANQLSISTKRVQIWFQNRRAKQKRRSRGSGEEDCAFSEEVKSSPPTSDSSGV